MKKRIRDRAPELFVSQLSVTSSHVLVEDELRNPVVGFPAVINFRASGEGCFSGVCRRLGMGAFISLSSLVDLATHHFALLRQHLVSTGRQFVGTKSVPSRRGLASPMSRVP